MRSHRSASPPKRRAVRSTVVLNPYSCLASGRQVLFFVPYPFSLAFGRVSILIRALKCVGEAMIIGLKLHNSCAFCAISMHFPCTLCALSVHSHEEKRYDLSEAGTKQKVLCI